jgi:hypothetical protein
MRTPGLVTLWVALVAFSAAAAAQEYQIKLDRPARAGDMTTRSTTITGKLHIVAKDGATVIDDRTTTYTIDYAADITVLAVDSTGNVTRDTHRIIKCRRFDGDVSTDYFQSGAVVTASFENGREVFTKDGKPVTPQQAGILRTLITLNPYGHTEDQVFGTTAPKKVGDVWPINAALEAQDLVGEMPKAPSYSGKAQLVGLVPVGGVDCIEIQVNMSNSSFAPVAPRGVSVISGASNLTAVSDYPVDTALPMLKRHSVYACDFQTYAPAPPSAGQQARNVTVDTHYEKTNDTSISPNKGQSATAPQTAPAPAAAPAPPEAP